MNPSEEILPLQLQSKKQAGEAIDLIDVRTPVEFQEVHVNFARNLPLDQFRPAALIAQRNGTAGPIYLICKSGSRARQAQQKLMAAGVEGAVCVVGGTDAWVALDLPVVRGRGRKVISLERQVRIAAGSLVLLGAILAWQLHIGFVALSAFVGAGLVFAGVTDTCGMAMILAKMPWNQLKSGA